MYKKNLRVKGQAKENFDSTSLIAPCLVIGMKTPLRSHSCNILNHSKWRRIEKDLPK
jgi:hypothetical protein